ncbi:MAG: glycosyl transferase family protein [uncultured bacterium]|nr:MAG: glycosyl transferase family protein [uncultured bacterium]
MQNIVALPKIFVVILNYNGIDTLSNCLSSVFQSDYENFEVVVVDNNSNDGSFEKARLNFSRAHFIKNSANVGFSQGNNVGIRFALEKMADALFILNNDTLIERTTITTLAQQAHINKQAGILSPVILEGNGNSIWFAGGKIDWKHMKTLHATTQPLTKPFESEYLSGCSMLIKKDVFKKIGLFDERYFLYYEDADLSLRANRAGFKLLIVPEAKIKHLEQSCTKNSSKTYWLVLSGLIFFLTHATTAQKIWIYPYIVARRLKNFYTLIFHPSPLARDIRRAFSDYSKSKKH